MYGIIDLGSNTIRLTVYRVSGRNFKILFSQKTTAGMAGYVENDTLSMEGIQVACEILNNYKSIFENFQRDKLFVFATASLRNIKNTQEAVVEVKKQTGLTVDVISGEREAILDFKGAVHSVDIDKGLLVDIGGGSTEILSFRNGKVVRPGSIPVGSLNLYSKNVTEILPKKHELKKIEKTVEQELTKCEDFDMPQPVVCGVGGTIRAATKLNNYMYSLPTSNRILTKEHIDYIYYTLTEDKSTAKGLILKVCPDRVHTIVPGMLLLKEIMNKFQTQHIVLSNYGVREGYLHEKIMEMEDAV